MSSRLDININNGKISLFSSTTGRPGSKTKKGSCCCRSFTIGSQSLNRGSLINFINGQISTIFSESEKKKYLLKKGWFFGCLGSSSNQNIRETLKFLLDRSLTTPIRKLDQSSVKHQDSIRLLEKHAGKEIRVPVGKSFAIQLWHSDSTGYNPWCISQIPSFITPIASQCIDRGHYSPDICGDGDDYEFTFEPNEPGKGNIVMQLPWSYDAGQTIEKIFTIIADTNDTTFASSGQREAAKLLSKELEMTLLDHSEIDILGLE